MECAHGPCTCVVEESGAFCSPDCSNPEPTGVACPCGHPQCAASTPDLDEPLV